jgi:hypothetical protein
MKKLFLHIALFFFHWFVFSNEQLANTDKGDFEKAKIGFEELLVSVPQNMQYFLEDHRLLPAVNTMLPKSNSIPFGQIQSRKRFG